MSEALRRAVIAVSVILAIAFGLALAGGDNGQQIGGISIFAFLIIVIFLIQWIVFVPSYLNRTEKYFDLVGGITNTSAMPKRRSLSFVSKNPAK